MTLLEAITRYAPPDETDELRSTLKARLRYLLARAEGLHEAGRAPEMAIATLWLDACETASFLGDDTERSPVLLDLHAMPSDERAEWCDALHQETLAQEDTRASLLIAAEGPMGAVAAHLAQRMVLRLPEHERPMQWRFFDPGTCLQMPRVLGPNGMAWLMGPVTAFMVPWAGQWALVERSHAQDIASAALTFKLSAAITPEDWKAMAAELQTPSHQEEIQP
mgnify:CR=1 FL=1